MSTGDIRQDKQILLGHVSGVHGIKGWLKIHSHTDPRSAIFDYQPWRLEQPERTLTVLESKESGKSLLARVKDVSTREEAEALVGMQIWVGRNELPEPGKKEFYWTDLVGLKVLNQDGFEFGSIRDMLATGANDVMVVAGDKERLIPFVMDVYVIRVDLEQGFVEVDWDPEF